jgi:hypothetical protein
MKNYYEDDNFEYEEDKSEYDAENNPIEDIIDKLNFCRIDYYKLYKKDYKTAAVRLRQNLEYIIQTAKQLKRDALSHRKEIEERHRISIEEAKNDGIL